VTRGRDRIVRRDGVDRRMRPGRSPAHHGGKREPRGRGDQDTPRHQGDRRGSCVRETHENALPSAARCGCGTTYSVWSDAVGAATPGSRVAPLIEHWAYRAAPPGVPTQSKGIT